MKEHEFKELLRESESTWLDWKRDFPPGLVKGSGGPEWEKGKGTLLKDLVSIANCDEERTGFLVYGVKAKGTKRIVTGIARSWDDADSQEWAMNTFKPPIRFSYSELEYPDTQVVGIFSVDPSPDYPHVAYQTINGVIYEGQTWYRRGSRNCVAHYEDLKDMFFRHTPLKAKRLGSQLEQDVRKHYESSGCTVIGASLSDKDNKLREGYKVAHYPRTRREVWFGEHNGQYQHILMLEPIRQ